MPREFHKLLLESFILCLLVLQLTNSSWYTIGKNIPSLLWSKTDLCETTCLSKATSSHGSQVPAFTELTSSFKRLENFIFNIVSTTIYSLCICICTGICIL